MGALNANGLAIRYPDLEQMARVIAERDDQVWVALDFSERRRYEELARAALSFLGVSISRAGGGLF